MVVKIFKLTDSSVVARNETELYNNYSETRNLMVITRAGETILHGKFEYLLHGLQNVGQQKHLNA